MGEGGSQGGGEGVRRTAGQGRGGQGLGVGGSPEAARIARWLEKEQGLPAGTSPPGWRGDD